MGPLCLKEDSFPTQILPASYDFFTLPTRLCPQRAPPSILYLESSSTAPSCNRDPSQATTQKNYSALCNVGNLLKVM